MFLKNAYLCHFTTIIVSYVITFFKVNYPTSLILALLFFLLLEHGKYFVEHFSKYLLFCIVNVSQSVS